MENDRIHVCRALHAYLSLELTKSEIRWWTSGTTRILILKCIIPKGATCIHGVGVDSGHIAADQLITTHELFDRKGNPIKYELNENRIQWKGHPSLTEEG